MRDLIEAEAPPPTPKKPQCGRLEAGPVAAALWSELKSLDLGELPVGMFRLHAAELAARARLLQDQGENAELIPERVIRKLTAVAGDRNIRGIHGLARHHNGDWEELARKARAERERLQLAARNVTQKVPAPPSAPVAAPKPVAKAPIEVDDDGDGDRESDGAPEYPRLREAARLRPVVLLGGRAPGMAWRWPSELRQAPAHASR